ncbi:MAG: PilZ domain-containing protein [Candidatus Methylomirabilales bacterium]
MKIVCAHCQAEGKPGVLGEMAPLGDATATYDICPEHRLRVEAEAGAVTAAVGEEDQGQDGLAIRRFDRARVALPVIGWAPQFLGTALQGVARHVGAGGMMVEFSVEVVRGTLLRVVLSTAQGPLEVEGEVVWTAGHKGVIRHGLAFPEPKESDFVALVVGKTPVEDHAPV